jgi:ATP-binding cassette, sub-family E, member 1
LKSSSKLTNRIAALDEQLCQPAKCGSECVVYCPVNKSHNGGCIIQRPNDGKAVISEDICTGCGICVKKCPFDAIVIVNIPKELGENKIHEYGINSFRIYRLPTLMKGSVVGLIGRNEIGKSTLLNILSGNIKPNFGNYESDLS